MMEMLRPSSFRNNWRYEQNSNSTHDSNTSAHKNDHRDLGERYGSLNFEFSVPKNTQPFSILRLRMLPHDRLSTLLQGYCFHSPDAIRAIE